MAAEAVVSVAVAWASSSQLLKEVLEWLEPPARVAPRVEVTITLRKVRLSPQAQELGAGLEPPGLCTAQALRAKSPM